MDIDKNVEPYLELQAYLIGCQIVFQAKSFDKITIREWSQYDVLLGADICFWDEMTRLLFRLLKRVAKAGVSFMAIAGPGREPFWALSGKCENKLNAETIEHTIQKPWNTVKHLLVIDQ